MSTGNEKRQRRRATRVRRANQPPVAETPATAPELNATEEKAREHFRREKARRAERTRPPEHPLEQARLAYQALLAADAERAKGGRPRKEAAPAKKKSSPASDEEADSKP